MAYCTQTQVEQRLQIDFTSDSDPVVAELISAAQGHIDSITERALERASRTEVFDPPEGDIWLTHVPASLTSCTVDGTALATSTDLNLESDTGRLARVTNGHRRSWGVSKLQSISVTYAGGYTTVPYDVQDICARMAARAFQAGASYAAVDADGVKQVSLQGSDSVTFTDTVEDINMTPYITPDEMESLYKYRIERIA